jgi:lysozyme family protein
MRLDFLKKLPTFETFGKGWSGRVADVKAKALLMAKEA